MKLTKDEAYAICDFLDTGLIQYIRDDPTIESVQWLVNIVNAFQKLAKYAEYSGLTTNCQPLEVEE